MASWVSAATLSKAWEDVWCVPARPQTLTSAHVGIGSGGPYALAAARALSDLPEMDAVQIAQKAMDVASDLCVYTNKEFITETLDTEDEKAD